MAIKTTKTKWRDVVLVCKKCQKKLDGGFGPDGDKTLKKALKKYLRPGDGKGRKGELAVIQTGCFDICPRNAVVAINATNPKALLIVPAGADLFEVKARLGLDDGRRLKPTLTVVGDD
jgi:predicted metal-binding protein